MVDSVTSLTGSGPRDWLWQRISAVVLAVYLLTIVGFWLCHPQAQFIQWQAFMQAKVMRLLGSLALLSLLAHAWVGMWTVLTDYVKLNCAWLRLSVQVAVILIAWIYLIWGLQIVWS